VLEIFESNEKSLESVELKINKQYSTVSVENTAAIRIKLSSKTNYISVKSRYIHLFKESMKLTSGKSEKDWIRYQITTEYDLDEISNILLYIYDDCKPSGTMFGCCSRFNACSDAKKCVNPNKQHAKNCWYNENLKRGKIFYGVNRNI
jgi:hypothetical protein